MNRQHLVFLTWLRALAALLVVVDHSVLAASARYFPEDAVTTIPLIQFFDVGTFAVDLFFTLSGCTLFLSYAGRLRRWQDAEAFYLARIFRVWPAFAFSLLVYLLFIELFRAFYVGDKSLWIAQFLHQYSLFNILQYLSLTFNLTGPRDLFVGPYWSLPVEFQYYLLLPIVLLIMGRLRFDLLVPLFFGAILYVLYERHGMHVDRYEVFKMGFTFFGGVFLACSYQKISRRLPAWMAIAGVMGTIVFAGAVRCGFIVIPASWHFVSDQENLFGVLGIFAVAFALFSAPFEGRTRAARFLQRYGEVSYSVYLFHMLFVGTAVLLVLALHIHDYVWKFAFLLSFSLIASYAFSCWSYKYVELPSIEWGKRLSRNRPGRDTLKPAA